MSTAPPPPTWSAAEPQTPALHQLAARLGQVEQLDPVAGRVASVVRGAIGPGRAKDLLSGTWLGHALHPLLTDLPIGTWTSAMVLDLIGGEDAEGAAELLLAVGVAAAVPTAVSGYTDWADTERTSPEVRRVGTVHAAANVTAAALYASSLAARRRGRRGRGRLLAMAGAGALAIGGHLGGHLAYTKGVGVDQTAFESGPNEWTTAAEESEVVAGRPIRAEVDGVGILLAREDGRIFALSDRCSHRGGPLHQGAVEDGCVTCPWHGSTFRLDDGSVVKGPATTPQPVYDVRLRDGKVEVRAHAAPTL